MSNAEWYEDLFVTAIENYGYGSFSVADYDPDFGTATLFFDDEPGAAQPVNLDTLRKGMGIIIRARLNENKERVNDQGESIEYAGKARENLIRSHDTCGDDGDYDVLDALAVLEIGLFGKVVYA